MVTYISVNIGPGNGLVPDSTKPLPEPMLTYQWAHELKHSPDRNFVGSTHNIPSNELYLKIASEITATFARANE